MSTSILIPIGCLAFLLIACIFGMATNKKKDLKVEKKEEEKEA